MDMTYLEKSLSNTFTEAADQVIAHLPRLLAALLVILLGWLLARLLRALVVRFIAGLGQVWSRVASRAGMDHLHLHLTLASLTGEVLFWLVILVSVFGAAQILTEGAATAWMIDTLAYLPSMLAGVLIIVLGVVLGSMVRSLLAAAAGTAHIARANQLGRTGQVLVVTVAVMVGVTQLGIDISFLTTLAAIILATGLGGIALAFGLGARTHAEQLLGMQQLRKLYKIGDEIRIGQVRGRILAFTTTAVLVETDEGRARLPADDFMRQVVITTASADSHDAA
ncbi:MAG: hypothetical protein U5J62_05930 [Desulfurivibrio sp.]|nr:hypothetical protein [Desulfurivibrio sp.]